MQQNKLFVGNLPFSSNEGDLQEAFERFGEIDEIRVITDRETGRSRGFAFITFESSESASEALSLDGYELSGRTLRVNFATERSGGNNNNHRNGSQSKKPNHNNRAPGNQ